MNKNESNNRRPGAHQKQSNKKPGAHKVSSDGKSGAQQGQKQKRSTTQKVLIFLIAFFLVILAGLATIILRETFTAEPDDAPGHDEIVHPVVPDDDPDDDIEDDWDHIPLRTPEPNPTLDGINPLTGEPFVAQFERNRPVAIVLNNLPEALPLNGVSDADVIYEYPVEGGLTRMLAIYQDVFYVEKIGCIRSARHYTVQLANAYDAILLSAGRSPQALAEVRSLGIPFLNEVEGPHREVFFRDRNRIPGRRVDNLHSVVTTGERLYHWLPEYDFRLTHEPDFAPSLTFTEDGTPQGGSAAEEILMRFSAAKSTTFTFDPTLSKYTVRQSNIDFVDANDGSQPAFANIVFIKTSVTGLRNDTAGRLDIVTTGSGTGYFASGGRYVRINWSRSDLSSPFIFTLEDGSGFDFGIGKSYICIIPTNIDPVFG
jgi:hypothetical protein